MSVPDLKECCQICIVHFLLGDGYGNETFLKQQRRLLLQLDGGTWGGESLAILNRAIKQHGYFITPEIILALLPDTTRSLCLKECAQLDEECLNVALKRCQMLQHLDLTENPLLNLYEVDLFSSTKCQLGSSLSSVILEDCSQVHNEHVQILLKNAPGLQQLNIARCEITDNVFLLDEQTQLAREACLGIKERKSTIGSQLQNVDVSRCSEFSSTGVRHLCTLCGPTLRTVNLSWTKVDCTAFLYLAGLGLPTAVEFFMKSGLMSSEMMEPLIYNLHQFDSICLDIAKKYGDDETSLLRDSPPRQQEDNTAIDISDIHPSLKSDVTIHTDGEKYFLEMPASAIDPQCNDIDIECEPKPLFEMSEQCPPSTNGAPSVQVITLDDRLQACPESNTKNAYKNQIGATCNVCDVSSNIVNASNSIETPTNDCDDTSGNNDNTAEKWGNHTNEIDGVEGETESEQPCDNALLLLKEEVILDDLLQNTAISKGEHVHEEEKNLPLTDQEPCDSCALNTDLKSDFSQKLTLNHTSWQQGAVNWGTNFNSPFFTSKIQSIVLIGNVFREETLGLQCFQEFLLANRQITSITIYSSISGNYLTDNILDLISSYARHLQYLCVEGSDRLTHIGISQIAWRCEHLSYIDMTGVSFVGDEGILPLVDRLPLTHLKLGETRITGKCLFHMASLPKVIQMQEVDLSWCEEIESPEALNCLVSSCPRMEKLWLRECCLSDTTLMAIAQNPHRLTQLSLASNMSEIEDATVVSLAENLPLLESIDLGWNSYLTNTSIRALLSNCPLLAHVNLEGLKRITSSPFLPIMTVPEELQIYLEEARSSFNCNNLGEEVAFEVKVSELPCLPHRSSTYCTRLKDVNLTYSDFVEDKRLQQIVTITHGGVEMLDYYGVKVEPSKSALVNFLVDFVEARG